MLRNPGHSARVSSDVGEKMVWGLAALLAAGCSVVQKAEKMMDPGPYVKEVRTVGEFHAIRLEGVADVVANVGEATPLEIEGGKNIVERTDTRVENGVLVVAMKPNTDSIRGGKVRIRVGTKSLDAVELKGVGSLEASGIEGESLHVDLQGVGGVKVAGRTRKLMANLTGTGSLNAGALEAQEVEVRNMGVGSADVHATQSLDALVAGVGSVTYSGQPTSVSSKVTGVGKIRKK